MIYKLQLRRQFTRMAEELNRQFQIRWGSQPSGGEGPDMTWVRQTHFQIPQWSLQSGSFRRVNNMLEGVYNDVFKPEPQTSVRRLR